MKKNNLPKPHSEMERYHTLDEVSYAISAEELSDVNRLLLCEACLKLPRDMVDKIGSEIFFLDFEYTMALHLRINTIKRKSIIFFSDEFTDLSDNEKIRIILHEIGHHILGHKSHMCLECCPDCFEQFEKEADDFAQKYLTDSEIRGSENEIRN